MFTSSARQLTKVVPRVGMFQLILLVLVEGITQMKRLASHLFLRRKSVDDHDAVRIAR